MQGKQFLSEISVQTHGISLVDSSRLSENFHWSIWINEYLDQCSGAPVSSFCCLAAPSLLICYFSALMILE